MSKKSFEGEFAMIEWVVGGLIIGGIGAAMAEAEEKKKGTKIDSSVSTTHSGHTSGSSHSNSCSHHNLYRCYDPVTKEYKYARCKNCDYILY